MLWWQPSVAPFRLQIRHLRLRPLRMASASPAHNRVSGR